MLRTMMGSKIRRATVTQADLHCVGSVTVDNGTRSEGYAIAGARGSGIVGTGSDPVEASPGTALLRGDTVANLPG